MRAERLGFLGILYKAHKAEIGFQIQASWRRIALLIVSSDADSGESKRLIEKAQREGKSVLFEELDSEELGNALGKPKVSLIALLDPKAAKAYQNKKGASV